MQRQLLIVLLFCTLCACPTLAITRWFTSTFNDLKWTLYRFGYCYAGLAPISSPRLNESQFLVSQMKTFLDQGNFSAEQLYNVSALMDRICLANQTFPNYTVSMHIDVAKYDSGDMRCQAIDDAMDSMYHVFKRAAFNHSEPLDFNSIQFYPNYTDRSASYNVIDLINTAWIKSMTEIEIVCALTNPIKEHVGKQIEAMSVGVNATAGASRREDKPEPKSRPLLDFINRLLDPILGLQKRLYWEGTSRLEQIQSLTMSGLVSMRDGIGSGGRKVFQFITNQRPNATLAASTNGTKQQAAGAKVNGTQVFSQQGSKASSQPLSATVAPAPAVALKNYTSSTTPLPSRLANSTLSRD